jgi:hypothetical protein
MTQKQILAQLRNALRRCAVLSAVLCIAAPPLPQAPSKSPRPAQPAPPPAIQFVDVARSAGLNFHLACGSKEKLYIMDAMCGGAAWLDFDRDGWMDILLVNGSTLEDLKRGTSPPSRLFRNAGNGTFTDVTAQSGLNFRGWGMGVAIGDYNNDGWPDVYITHLQGGVLYRNNGDGTFRDVTAEARVSNDGLWGTSAAFGDYDRDGHLDLYIANYVTLDLNNLPEFGKGPFCQYRGIPVSCGPRGLPGARDHLYHNNGDGTFTDVTQQLGIDPDSYFGLGVIWGDYDKDGDSDIYVANDSTPSLLYRNNGDATFTEVGLQAGVALSADGREQAGMGVDFGDYDNDGWPDLAKTNFSDDTNNLYRNTGQGSFDDAAGPAGFGPISIPHLAFGVKFFDYDHDGWKDIWVRNGHVNPQVDGHKFGVTYAQRDLVFRNLKSARFEELGLKLGPDVRRRAVGRAAATADFDHDGDLDLLATSLDGSPVLLRNDGGNRNPWLRFRLQGTKSNRDGYGARVELTAGGITQTDEVRAGSGYVSSSDPALHFGLGAATRAARIIIHWPSGAVNELAAEMANQELVVRESVGVIDRRSPAVAVQSSKNTRLK